MCVKENINNGYKREIVIEAIWLYAWQEVIWKKKQISIRETKTLCKEIAASHFFLFCSRKRYLVYIPFLQIKKIASQTYLTHLDSYLALPETNRQGELPSCMGKGGSNILVDLNKHPLQKKIDLL